MNTSALEILEARKLAQMPALMRRAGTAIRKDPLGAINAGVGIASIGAPLIQAMTPSPSPAKQRKQPGTDEQAMT